MFNPDPKQMLLSYTWGTESNDSVRRCLHQSWKPITASSVAVGTNATARLLAADRAQVSRWNLRTDQKFQNFKPPVIRISGIGRAEALSYRRAARNGLLAPSNSNA